MVVFRFIVYIIILKQVILVLFFLPDNFCDFIPGLLKYTRATISLGKRLIYKTVIMKKSRTYNIRYKNI